MSRRLSLSLSATAALALSLAAAAFAPGAVTAPLPLPSVLQEQAVEEGRPEGQERRQERLTVTASGTDAARGDGSYELRCVPAGGTHPDAASACARLDELAAEGKDPFAPVPQGQMCTMQMGGPAAARVTGSWQGRSVDATFSHKNGCEISRWQNLVPVLPAARG